MLHFKKYHPDNQRNNCFSRLQTPLGLKTEQLLNKKIAVLYIGL